MLLGSLLDVEPTQRHTAPAKQVVDEDIKVEFPDIATAVNGNDNGEVGEAAATNTDSAHSDDEAGTATAGHPREASLSKAELSTTKCCIDVYCEYCVKWCKELASSHWYIEKSGNNCYHGP